MADLPIQLGWHQDRLIGLLAASQPLNHTTWIRLGAAFSRLDTQLILETLWAALRAELRAQETQAVYLLAVNDWLARYVPQMGFYSQETVVTLIRSGWELPPARKITVDVRPATEGDLLEMLAVDNAAFAPPWQLSLGEMRQAYRIAHSCTVALQEGRIIGYQISTIYHATGHLARLAVLPEFQGAGIGGVLLEDLVKHFWRRHIQTITVNTQASNIRSQNLYMRYGFIRNGYDLAVWETQL